VQPPGGSDSPLGRILWLRFRLELDVPPGFSLNPGLHTRPRPCPAGYPAT